jgi:holo-[acyl-carrier protein] synthase
MILGVGVDIVSVNRLESILKYPRAHLLKIFSQEELDYCNKDSKSLAGRFAAKEAFYKALSGSLCKLNLKFYKCSFILLSKYINVINDIDNNIPYFKIDWTGLGDLLKVSLPKVNTHLSISHEKLYAVSVVIIESV